MIENVSAGEHLYTSDHQVARWKLLTEQSQEVEGHLYRFNFYKADYDLVTNWLKRRHLESEVRGMKLNDAWKTFKRIMREIIGENTPNRVSQNTKKK